jgi:hypothetical protein
VREGRAASLGGLPNFVGWGVEEEKAFKFKFKFKGPFFAGELDQFIIDQT